MGKENMIHLGKPGHSVTLQSNALAREHHIHHLHYKYAHTHTHMQTVKLKYWKNDNNLTVVVS